MYFICVFVGGLFLVAALFFFLSKKLPHGKSDATLSLHQRQ
jgi:hypothetical protein